MPLAGLVESTNTKIRLLTRIAFGFRTPEALVALAMLALGGHRPSLPGRAEPDTHGSVSRAEVLYLKTSFASVPAFPERPRVGCSDE